MQGLGVESAGETREVVSAPLGETVATTAYSRRTASPASRSRLSVYRVQSISMGLASDSRSIN
jgi:hypothetical protein